jgi:toxin ParE1/3/4
VQSLQHRHGIAPGDADQGAVGGEVERQILTIAAMPTRWMVASGDIWKSLLKRFPYVIPFRIVGDDTIRVTVVKHERRHPAFGVFRK